MKAKKLLALLMSLVLLLGALAVPALAADDGRSWNSSTRPAKSTTATPSSPR